MVHMYMDIVGMRSVTAAISDIPVNISKILSDYMQSKPRVLHRNTYWLMAGDTANPRRSLNAVLMLVQRLQIVWYGKKIYTQLHQKY